MIRDNQQNQVDPSRRPSHARSRKRVFECLEGREAPAINLLGVPAWVEQGPGPIEHSNFVQGMEGQNSPVAGAVEALAPHPDDPDILYVGSVNGGIWRTGNATEASPSWRPLTDAYPSLAVADLAFSPLDAARQTLFAGIGHTSRIRGIGSGRSGSGDNALWTGVMRTLDGGETWRSFGQFTFGDVSIRSVLPTRMTTVSGNRPIVFAAAVGNRIDAQLGSAAGGLDQSSDNGETWQALSGLAGGNQLPAGDASDIVADPGNVLRYYAGVAGQGIYRTEDGGLTWSNVTQGIVNSLAADARDNDGDGSSSDANDGSNAIARSKWIELAVVGDPAVPTNPI